MLKSLAKIAVTLNADNVANSLIERFYGNSPRAGGRFSRRFQILAYHKVSHDNHPLFEPTHPATFEQHVKFLSRSYRVLSLSELLERSARGDVPERAVAITFDDGYRDNYEFAFPILKKYGLPATIFVATGVIGNGKLLWHDRIFDAFRFATAKRVTLSNPALGELILETEETRLRSLRLVLSQVRALYGKAQVTLIEEVEKRLKPELSKEQGIRMLNWEQIREMYRTGIEFGSHTVNHPILSRIPREEAVKELSDSRQQLSEQLGVSISLFAYPNGRPSDYNDDLKVLLKQCGYTSAVTTRPGFNRPFADPFELKRDQPWHKEIGLFRVNLFLQRHGLAC